MSLIAVSQRNCFLRKTSHSFIFTAEGTFPVNRRKSMLKTRLSAELLGANSNRLCNQFLNAACRIGCL